jgi:hypothetical protein
VNGLPLILGKERTFVTAPLELGKKVSYRIKARCNGTLREWDVAAEAGGVYRIVVPPAEFTAQVEQDGVRNFGIMRDQLAEGPEKITCNREEITKADAKKLLETGSLTDDSGKLRLTLIGPADLRQKVLDDLRGPLAPHAKDLLVQSYPADHWSVARAGFQTSGSPTIYLQEASGKVLHRQDDYADGPDGLKKAIESVRRPDPSYDRAQDPDRRRTADKTTWLVAGLAGLFLFLGTRKEQR